MAELVWTTRNEKLFALLDQSAEGFGRSISGNGNSCGAAKVWSSRGLGRTFTGAILEPRCAVSGPSVAERKMLENVFRYVNIALVNELASS